MSFDHISNPELRLGLGLGLDYQFSENCVKTGEYRQKKKEKDPTKCNKAYPSLTLGPSKDDEANNQIATKTESDEYFHPQTSSPSAVSSFSNSSSIIKRERDQFEVEEFEIEEERNPSRDVVIDEENGNPRKKLRLNKEQSAVLEDSFKEHSTLNPIQKQELARKLKLRARQVEVWFQNRRARTKLKQTEVDLELLRQSCENLTEENKRLQKELQDLKSIKTTPYITIICPSCERICGGNGSSNNGSSPTTTLLRKAHNHLCKSNYSFTQSSAAC
ncbi:hypothetical protein Lal_00004866 [Lupinus albus]|uniref:Putative transcription factor homeobox-WOX family n=1 Tax=Lupinus albus TaxID=3870 RepID=A0A6A4MU80_LUPAL|nr:putative transcription factor homeobox-WOX family [Lupinus albus]KAF1865490.1 hypothetical protein Lal_00004866 [Lupinus albus]